MGTVWATGCWVANCWAAGTWADLSGITAVYRGRGLLLKVYNRRAE